MSIPLLVAGPTAEPVTLAEMRNEVNQLLDVDDAILSAKISEAREWVETASDRQLTVSTWELRLPGFGGRIIELPLSPLASVLSVQYLDTDGQLQTLDPSAYVAVTSKTPGCLYLADGQDWPGTAIHPEAVRIVFVTGQQAASVPPLAKAAIRMLAAHLYYDREGAKPIPENVQSLAWSLGSYRY